MTPAARAALPETMRTRLTPVSCNTTPRNEKELPADCTLAPGDYQVSFKPAAGGAPQTKSVKLGSENMTLTF